MGHRVGSKRPRALGDLLGFRRLFGGQDLRDGFLQSALGVTNIKAGDAGAAVGKQPIQTTRLAEDVQQLGVNQVLDGSAELFRLGHKLLLRWQALLFGGERRGSPRRRNGLTEGSMRESKRSSEALIPFKCLRS